MREQEPMNVPISDLKPLLAAVAAGRRLSESQAEAAFEIIMSGNATPSQMGAFLMALRVRGETVDEITGAARIMRAKALTLEAPPGTIDTVGTGGDGSGTFNISTATALVAAVLGRRGAERAWVVHGSGIDELTTAGITKVAEFHDGRVIEFDVTPEEAGLKPASLDELKGAEPAHNAALMREVLGGARGPLRDIVLLNSGAALVVAGRADNLRHGADMAATTFDSGAAAKVLDRLVAITNA